MAVLRDELGDGDHDGDGEADAPRLRRRRERSLRLLEELARRSVDAARPSAAA
jgi:hypothetical protein